MSSRALVLFVLALIGGCGRIGYRAVNDTGIDAFAETSDDTGVRADVGPVDANTFDALLDAGVPDAGADAPMGDAGCVSGAACSTGNACESGVVDCSSGAGVCVPMGPRPAGTLCRSAAGECDVAEFCDGVSTACAVDTLRAPGAECRATVGSCDVAERCDGTSPSCPSDVVLPNGTLCRASTELCDASEMCDGVQGECLLDARVPEGTVCRPARSTTCDFEERCGFSGPCPDDIVAPAGGVCPGGTQTCDGRGDCIDCISGSPCDTGHPCEVGSLDCSSMPPRCVASGPRSSGSFTCRAARGPCDVEEQCDGTDVDCPADAFAGTSTMCRAPLGVCDAPEMCTGVSASCPLDLLRVGTTCSGTTGPCDVVETCDGTSVNCPADAFAPATLQCRSVRGACDVADFCTGAGPACPADALAPASTECAAAADCRFASQCTGLTAICPAPMPLPAGSICSLGECDALGVCGLRAVCDSFRQGPLSTPVAIATYSGGVAMTVPGQASMRDARGAPVWTRMFSQPRAVAVNNTVTAIEDDNRIQMFETSTGTAGTLIDYRPASGAWQRSIALGPTGRILVATNSPDPWSVTVGGVGISSSGLPITLLLLHDATGVLLTSLQVASRPQPLLMQPLADGRWVIAVANGTTPLTFGGHVVAAGTNELIILGPMLEFLRAEVLPFAPLDLATAGTLRVVGGRPGVAAYDDSGRRWSRPDCSAETLAVSDVVHVAEENNGPYCGIPISTPFIVMRKAELDLLTGVTRSGTWIDVGAGPLALDMSSNGTLYTVFNSGVSVCGRSEFGPTLFGF